MKIDQQMQKLRASGFRITRARSEIVSVLHKAQSPLSAQEIQEKLMRQNVRVHKTTMYREIIFLLNQRIISEVDFGDGAKRYELLDGEHHHHFVCTSCRSVAELSIEKKLLPILQVVSQQTGGTITHHAVEFFGTCSTCVRAAA